jgi:hypothetical protein
MVLSTGVALFWAQKIVKKRGKKCFIQKCVKNGGVTGRLAIPGFAKSTMNNEGPLTVLIDAGYAQQAWRNQRNQRTI